MRQSTSNSSSSADLQLTHHNFRWVLFSVHAEPVRGLLGRHLHRRRAAEDAERRGPGGAEGEDPDDGLGRVVSWLPKVWNHVNRFLEAHCFVDVTIGLYNHRRRRRGVGGGGGSGRGGTCSPKIREKNFRAIFM